MLITCWKIYTSRPPFLKRRYDQAVAVVLDGTLPPRPTTPQGENMNDDLWNIVSSCLAYDPEDRPSMSAVHKSILVLLL